MDSRMKITVNWDKGQGAWFWAGEDWVGRALLPEGANGAGTTEYASKGNEVSVQKRHLHSVFDAALFTLIVKL
jgi:hypothetical protein